MRFFLLASFLIASEYMASCLLCLVMSGSGLPRFCAGGGEMRMIWRGLADLEIMLMSFS